MTTALLAGNKKFGVGQPVLRQEDKRFITGQGCYTSDVAHEGAFHAAFLRSPYAHAKFTITDTSAALAITGVKAVYTAKDFASLGNVPCLAPMKNADGSLTPLKPNPVLAADEVFHVGDALAMCIADTEAAARAALEAIMVDWQPLPAVASMLDAIAPGAPLVFDQAPGNVAYDNSLGDAAATEAAFKSAAHIVSLDIINNRLIANYMETRSAIGVYDSVTKTFTLTCGSQGVHSIRDGLAGIFQCDKDSIRVITPDVGGGFGTKAFLYREYPLVLEAARKLGHPVRWTADRTEHFLSDAQGRDNLTTATMALDKDGKFLALKLDIIGNLGAYPSQFGPYIHWLGATMATGTYDIKNVHARVRGVYTNTQPVDAYRGAGRPEAAYVLERLVDACARTLKMPREELRAKNFIKPTQMPYNTATGRTYDVGDFEGAMRAALVKADYASFPARRLEAEKRGKIRGFGFASYIECTAWGNGEEGSVTLDEDGGFTIRIGTQSNGQGHATSYAQIVTEALDIAPEHIRMVQGDTSAVPSGHGTGGSRSIPIGCAMLTRACDVMVARIKDLASDALEVGAQDLELVNGQVRIKGTDRALSYAEVAKLPGATLEKRCAIESFTPECPTYPNGTHCCEVEIDPDTGVAEIVGYSIVDDFGTVINPLLLAGQVHGGVVQGIGQALMEQAVFDRDGQLLSASFMDYTMPRADTTPNINIDLRSIPSTTNPLGLKGAGEAGSIGSSPAVMNAVIDALYTSFDVTHIDMPATPFAIYKAIAAAKPMGKIAAE